MNGVSDRSFDPGGTLTRGMCATIVYRMAGSPETDAGHSFIDVKAGKFYVKAVAWAQARRGIPAFGTTHADHFHGAVPCTRELTPAEVADDYELNTGRVIEERFHDLDAEAFPGVLVAGHGPFTWGPTPRKAVENAVALEQIAAMALDTLRLDPDAEPAPSYVLDKHYFRKHGPGAYYGQK